jgi:hypothetical protein
MSILRKIQKIIIGCNHDHTIRDNLGQSGEIHNESDLDGSIESIYIEERMSQKCGCFADAGGRCAECGAVSCVRCHQHCGGNDNTVSQGCGKPICREHTRYQLISGTTLIPFCGQCAQKMNRKKQRQIVVRLLLSPLIEQERPQ